MASKYKSQMEREKFDRSLKVFNFEMHLVSLNNYCCDILGTNFLPLENCLWLAMQHRLGVVFDSPFQDTHVSRQWMHDRRWNAEICHAHEKEMEKD